MAGSSLRMGSGGSAAIVWQGDSAPQRRERAGLRSMRAGVPLAHLLSLGRTPALLFCMSIERFCRKQVATALATETVQAAAERITQQHVGALVIVDESGRPVGILTDRDIVCRVMNERRDPGTTSIQEVMSANPVVARDSERIDQVAFTMHQKGVRRVPIVNASGKAVGLVSLDDLLVLLASELGQTAAAVRMNRGP